MQATKPVAPGHTSPGSSLSRAVLPSAIFLVSSALLLLGMSDRPFPFDEGITLTDALMVGAGRVPHRDFRAIYGPAHSYVLAGLFHLFGASLIVERVFAAIVAGLIVTSLYLVARTVCRNSVALWTAFGIALWLFGLNAVQDSAIYTVSLINLWAVATILPVFTRRISIGRFLAAGALAGLAGMFRYDAGLAMLGVLVVAVAFAQFLRLGRSRWQEYAASLAAVCGGYLLVTVPPVLYYLSVAPFHAFYVDMVLYFRLYYAADRGLPFPGFPRRESLSNIAIYTPIVISLIALTLGFTGGWRLSEQDSFLADASLPSRRRRGFLLLFGLLCGIMYFKGWVRPDLAQMYLSIVPSLLLIALLYEYRLSLRPAWRIAVVTLTVLSVFACALDASHTAWSMYKNFRWVPQVMLAQARGTLPQEQIDWCRTPSPLTRGLCFLPGDGRIRTIEFLRTHTTPQDKLFVANGRNDKVYANDNLLYFATGRLPATHWFQFDPPLQRTYPIQTEIVADLQANKPPYIVTDSEFDTICEPNDSCRSSGVLLLDNYIHTQYRYVETDCVMTIWQRIPTP